MRFTLLLLAVWGAGILLPASAAFPDTMVLDGDDVSDWTRVYSMGSWKHRDACLHPNALLKFDLSGMGPVTEILDARLHRLAANATAQPCCRKECWSHIINESCNAVLRGTVVAKLPIPGVVHPARALLTITIDRRESP